MIAEHYGKVRIFRSSPAIVHGLRVAARSHLLDGFRVGEYRGAAEINSLIQQQYAFFARRLESCLPKLVSNDALQFVLFQYDEAAQILHGHGIDNDEERSRWLIREGNLRRALKYLAEMICLHNVRVPAKCSRRESWRAMDQALLCAEMMLDMAEMSNRVFSIFPHDCAASVYAEGGPLDWEVHITGRFAGYDREMMTRLERDRKHRADFLEGHAFDIDGNRHAEVLDPAFESAFGWSYARFIGGLGKIVDGSVPAPGEFPTLFIERRKIVEQFVSYGEPQAAVERMLAGFTIDPAKMEAEQRVAWNPKQENRAYRRGFFQCPHRLGTHLAFSRAMAKECLIHLVHGLAYKRIPVDWRHPTIDAALVKLSDRAGNWFENAVRVNLHRLGFVGGRAQALIGSGTQEVIVPPEVGELDFVGVSVKERLILLVEAKMVNSGVEAKFWRDDISEFTNGPKSYASKFRRKIAWVRSNSAAVAAALGVAGDVRIAPVMITLYPCIARLFISDFQCVSITEFMLDYGISGSWPYESHQTS